MDFEYNRILQKHNDRAEKIDDFMRNQLGFKYSINEGGWVNYDLSMIVYTWRFPYCGTVTVMSDSADILTIMDFQKKIDEVV